MGISWDMNHTEHLVEIGKLFTSGNNTENLLCATAGGSVGRGDVDEYSDLDLNFYTLDGNSYNESNVIQLHSRPLPTLKQISENPWEYRFIKESRILYDPTQVFIELKTKTQQFFKSKKGRDLMRIQAEGIVKKRISWAVESIEKGDWITAGIAARSAWVDAGFSYLFFNHGTLSTGSLLPVLRKLVMNNDLGDILFQSDLDNSEVLLRALKRYRAYICQSYGKQFEVDPIQDDLIKKKIERYKKMQDFENINFHLYGEVFGCLLSTNEPIERHISNLPTELREDLMLLGFRPYSKEEIHLICQQAIDIQGGFYGRRKNDY